jgi:hypothetical protein
LKGKKIANEEPCPTQEEFLCAKDPTVAESPTEYEACLRSKKELVAEINRKATAYLIKEQKEAKLRAEKARVEAIRQEKEAEKERQKLIALQKEADTKQCVEYGFRRRTDKLAECIMNIRQARANDERAREVRQQIFGFYHSLLHPYQKHLNQFYDRLHDLENSYTF